MRSLTSLGTVRLACLACLALAACKSDGGSKTDTDGSTGSGGSPADGGTGGGGGSGGQDRGTKLDTGIKDSGAAVDHTISSTQTVVYVTGGDTYIRILDFDLETGALSTTFRKSPQVQTPGFLAWDKQRKYLYA